MLVTYYENIAGSPKAPMVEVFTDGSSSGEKGKPIGWGWIITRDQKVLAADYGWQLEGTNNMAELIGAISGLEAVVRLGLHKDHGQVILVTDSLYAMGMALQKYEPKANVELALKIGKIGKEIGISVRWVRGHSVDPRIPWQDNEFDSLMNHRADSLAKHGKTEAKKVVDEKVNLHHRGEKHGK